MPLTILDSARLAGAKVGIHILKEVPSGQNFHCSPDDRMIMNLMTNRKGLAL
jgi:hypothetical protein